MDVELAYDQQPARAMCLRKMAGDRDGLGEESSGRRGGCVHCPATEGDMLRDLCVQGSGRVQRISSRAWNECLR